MSRERPQTKTEIVQAISLELGIEFFQDRDNFYFLDESKIKKCCLDSVNYKMLIIIHIVQVRTGSLKKCKECCNL